MKMFTDITKHADYRVKIIVYFIENTKFSDEQDDFFNSKRAEYADFSELRERKHIRLF